MTTFIAL